MTDEVRVPGLSDHGERREVEAPDAAAETTYAGIHEVLSAARTQVASVVNTAMVQAYWNVGRQIVEAQGERAEYSKRLLHYLAQRLTSEFGPGFDESNLRNMRRFYTAFPIRDALRPELSWIHYRELTKIPNPQHREFYAREAAQEGWTARQLHRQIATLYYERILATRKDSRNEVSAEISEHEPRTGADDLLEDPYVFEFLDVAEPRRPTRPTYPPKTSSAKSSNASATSWRFSARHLKINRQPRPMRRHRARAALGPEAATPEP